MRRFHVRPFGPLYGLLGGVGQGHQLRKELVQILYGETLLGLLVDVLRNGEACPYGRGDLADIGGDRPLAYPKQAGHSVLDQVGAVVHQNQEHPVPQVQGERAARADTTLAVRPVEPLLFGFGVGLFDISHQKIKLLEGHADGGSEGAGVL